MAKQQNNGNKRNTKYYLRSNVRTLAIKCYEEQMPEGWESVKIKIKQIDKKYLIVIAIKHDRDPDGDNFWAPSTEKPHYHIIVRVVPPAPPEKIKPERIGKILDLLGIEYRPDKDETLWNEHGVETCSNFCAYAMYLTHETEQAIQDGKELYYFEELISNVTDEELKQIREGYLRPTYGRVSMMQMEELDKAAYEKGTELKDFTEWYRSLPFMIRCNTKMRIVEQSYWQGVADRLKKGVTVNRLSVYIKADGNCGKTYAAKQALAGKSMLTVDGGGSGRYDHLQLSTNAIILDDATTGSLLNMADNYACQIYRRNNNNPVWLGQYFIVTSNLDFEEWVRKCGLSSFSNIQAARTRFYVCSVRVGRDGKKYLVCESESTRGSEEVLMEKRKMFMDFKAKYNESIQQYNPENIEIDIDELNDYGEVKYYHNSHNDIMEYYPPAPPVKKPPRLKPTKEEKFKKHCEKANDECGRIYGVLQRMLPKEEQLNHQSIRDKFRELYAEYSDVPDECFDEMFL